MALRPASTVYIESNPAASPLDVWMTLALAADGYPGMTAMVSGAILEPMGDIPDALERFAAAVAITA